MLCGVRFGVVPIGLSRCDCNAVIVPFKPSRHYSLLPLRDTMWRLSQLTRCVPVAQSGSSQTIWPLFATICNAGHYEKQMFPAKLFNRVAYLSAHHHRAATRSRVATHARAASQPSSSVCLLTQRSITSASTSLQLSFGAKKRALFGAKLRQSEVKSFCVTNHNRAIRLLTSPLLATQSNFSNFCHLATLVRMEQFALKPKNFSTSTEQKEISFRAPKIGDCLTVEVDRHYLKSDTKQKVLRIIVEGNIGSGKTTFLEIFYKNSASLLKKPLVMPEPIDLWRDVGGVNIFQLLADDPKRWSFTFQSYVQLTMIKIHELMPKDGDIKVMERSLFSARYCFVENLHRKQLLEPCEYYVLDQWFKSCLPSAEVDLIIYLRTDPDVVFERIQRRARPEESKLTLDYLRTLHELHEDWLVREKFPLPAPVMTINANVPLEKIMSVYEEKTGGILRQYHT